MKFGKKIGPSKIAFQNSIRWILFALYLSFLLTFPFTILGDYLGLGFGLSLSLIFLLILYIDGGKKIFERLNLRFLSLAEAPEVHHIVNELSRRLNLPSPRITVLKSDALNIGAFGLQRKQSFLVLTDGILLKMSRPQLSALIGRELTAIWYGDCLLTSWFSRFLSILETLTFSQSTAFASKGKRFYSLQWIVSQMIFLPIAIVPDYLLLGIRRKVNLDLESIKVTRLPKDLAEGYRLMEASSSRIALKTPNSLSPLFLLQPAPTDPIAKLIFNKGIPTSLLSSINDQSHYL